LDLAKLAGNERRLHGRIEPEEPRRYGSGVQVVCAELHTHHANAVPVGLRRGRHLSEEFLLRRVVRRELRVVAVVEDAVGRNAVAELGGVAGGRFPVDGEVDDGRSGRVSRGSEVVGERGHVPAVTIRGVFGTVRFAEGAGVTEREVDGTSRGKTGQGEGKGEG